MPRRRAVLSHVDAEGRPRMVDVSHKTPTARRAVARGHVAMNAQARGAIRDRRISKGDPLAAARLAGVMAAKKTADLIPLCHPLALTHVDVDVTPDEEGYAITAAVRTTGPTGVEMEALTAVAVAALTIYDMAKAVDPGMTISGIRLVEKTGGKRDIHP